MSEAYTIILVYATSYALKVEKILLMAGICSNLIPVPRHLNSDCGVCVRIGQMDRENAEAAIHSANIPIEGFHDLD